MATLELRGSAAEYTDEIKKSALAIHAKAHKMYIQNCIYQSVNTIFEWDKEKAESNIRKHGVSFELASRTFADSFAFTRQDRFENGEYRWQTIGMVEGVVLLLVAHTVRDHVSGDEVIRIISARPATRQERKTYEQQNS